MKKLVASLLVASMALGLTADHLIPQQVQASPQEPLLLAQRLQQLQKQQPQTLRQMCSTSTWQVSRITLILH